MSIISKIKTYFCKFPLRVDYKLSFGTVHVFDTLLIEIEDSEGKIGYGEATFLPGYGDERPKESISISNVVAKKIIKNDISDALLSLEKYKINNPFLITAFSSAIENITRKSSNKKIKVPIIGLINEWDEKSIKDDIENFINNRYIAIKTKIGIDTLKNDLKKLKLMDKYNDGQLKIRVDANQSLEKLEIKEIIKYFSSFNIQYLEQPFKAENFEKHLELNNRSPFPIMLDESIWDISKIDLVVNSSISEYIKLKLQKCGGLSLFESMINYIKNKKLKIVIGNGVQTDLNCIFESLIFDKCGLNEPAENIGFSKLVDKITKNEISTEKGIISIEDKPIELNWDIINKHTISKHNLE